MPLFNFTLTPLDKVQPWGKIGSAGWFGLTYGHYWIEVGDEKLFEYHEDNPWKIDAPRFVDYQIVRLYEDILEMARSVLDPIPKSLEKHISGDGYNEYSRAWVEWIELERGDRQHSEIADAATLLGANRVLDSGYLIAAPKIRLWSDAADVHIEWDNRDCIHEGKTVWSTQRGTFILSREAFIEEVRDFHNRLMAQMQERVNQVCAGALPPEVEIDFVGLREEHEKRSAPIEAHFAPPAEPTDWTTVERAIAAIMRKRPSADAIIPYRRKHPEATKLIVEANAHSVRIPNKLRLPYIDADTEVSIRQLGRGVFIEPLIGEDSWHDGFFAAIRIDDEAFVRPPQTTAPPKPNHDT